MNKNKKLVNAVLVSTMLLSGMALNVSADEDPAVVRLGGNTRVETSNVVSSTTYEKADTVIIAGYNGEVDALTGTILASVHKAPLLLVSEKEKDFEKTEAEIKRLGAKNVILLGDEGVISKHMASKIEKIGLKVSRAAGKDRFDTAVAVAKAAGETHEHIFLTNDGRSGELADALAAGPVSGRDQDPILLTAQAKLPSQTLQALKDLKVQRVTIIGQEGAVSAGVKAELEALGIKVDRVGGKNRWETAELIAENYFGDSEKVVVTNDGRISYADALVGGYLGAKENAPVLLTQADKLNEPTKNFLGSKATFAYVLGGEMVVSKAVFTSVEEIILKNIEDELEAEKQAAIIKATEAVEKAEEIKGNYEVIAARKLVDALPESAIKTELTERLDAVVAEREADRAAVVEAIEDLSAASFEIVGADKETATIKLKGNHPNGSTYEFAGAGSGFFGYTINDDSVVIENRYYKDQDLYFTFFVKAKKGTAGQHSGNFSVSIPGSDLIGTNRGTIIVKDSFDEVVATRVDQSIQDLPAADEVTLEDKEVVKATRDAYDNLSKKQKEFVTEFEKLEAVEAALATANKAMLEVATTAVEKAEAITAEKVETGEARENLKAAEKLVVKLLDNKEKDALVKRLDAVELAIEEIEAELAAKKALAVATEAVEKAEKSALLVDFNAAQLLVDELIDSEAKTALQKRLDQIEVNLTVEEQLIKAEKELVKAEDAKKLKQEIIDRDEAEIAAAEKAAEDATAALWGYLGNITQENKEDALKRLDEVEALVHKALNLGSEKELQEEFDYVAGFIRDNIEKVEKEAEDVATAAVVKA